MTPKELLIKAKALIATPDKWTKEYSARTAEGTPTSFDDPEAVCFCSYGAIDKASLYGEGQEEALDGAYEALRSLVPDGYVAIYNDHPNTTHDMVLAMFDKAIGELP